MGISVVKDDVTEAAEKSDSPSENNDLDAFGKAKGKDKSNGKCNVCGGDGH